MTSPHADSLTSENAPGRLFLPVGLAVLFLAVVLIQGYVKLLWRDELLIYWVGRNESFLQIWRGLGSGANSSPPLTYLLSAVSARCFGTSALALRLPSIFEMGLGLACLWVLLRRRFAPIYAAIGCLVVMTTPVLDFGYEATEYSLIFAVGIAANLLYWQAFRVRGLRRVALLLALPFLVAVANTPFTFIFFLIVPVGCGVVWVMTWLVERLGNQRVAVGVVAVLCVATLGRQAVCGVALLRQEHAFTRLVDVVERSAAPGEAVIVYDPVTALPVHWYGSAALREQIALGIDPGVLYSDRRELVFPFRVANPAELLRPGQEFILIAEPDGALARDLRGSGAATIEEETTVRWERLKGVSTPMVRQGTRVLLVVPK